MVAQQKDAEAVLATLWDVNDASTSHHERLLCALGQDPAIARPKPAPGPACFSPQLIRLAHSGTGRGVQVVRSRDPGTSYAHPYYWAPFVLIGNYQ